MPQTPIEVVRAILADPTNIAVVQPLTAADATYVSLNYNDPELKKLMPWCGTGQGAQTIVDAFVNVGRAWETLEFDLRDVFGSGDNVAVFGSFTYRSTAVGKLVTSPFAIFAKVSNGKLTYMQFMEDTFATARSFRSRGTWTFQTYPGGAEVDVGD